MQKKKRAYYDELIGFTIVGVILMLLPYIYCSPSYEQLEEKEIVVSDVGYVVKRYIGRSYYLITADGARLQIRGELSYEELKENLQPNTKVTVKYYRGLHKLTMTDYVKELTCNGKRLVTYRANGQLGNQIVSIIGILAILYGVISHIFKRFPKKVRG